MFGDCCAEFASWQAINNPDNAQREKIFIVLVFEDQTDAFF
jgi:hypothetical protein